MNIIGAGCCGPGESDRYLKETLENLTRITDKVVILGDMPDEKTSKICKEFKGVTYYETTERLFNTKQWLLKQTLLSLVGKENPDWIYCSDMDEVPDNRINRQVLGDMANKGVNSYGFTFVHLWGDREHIRISRGWRGLNKVIFYRYQPDKEQKFPKKSLHCGLVPEYANKNVKFSGMIVKHLGYMLPKDRPAKIERYEKYDKLGFIKPKWFYDSIKTNGEVDAFDESEFIQTMPTE